jgi:feruloyl-CoA synthase
MKRPVRESGVLPAAAEFDQGSDGVTYVRSPRPLGPYPAKITERLEYWAERAPDRAFLAQRGPDGQWQRLTYRDTLTRVRRTAQGLLDRGLSAERPIAILSGNSIEHAVLALAALYTGAVYAPIAPAYSLASNDFGTLRQIWGTLRPALVLAGDSAFDRAIDAVASGGVERISSCAALECAEAGRQVDCAHARVGPDTVGKILFTSGSTGQPKGVINTQRMLSSNQEMIRAALGCLAEEPPVLCDWLPWNHTFGGNHNFGIVLYNGGTLYIDDGRPTGSQFARTIENLREIATTAYFNVPKGYEMLVSALRDDEALRRTFFRRVRILFYAAAGLRQKVWDDLQDLAYQTCGEEILMVTGLGSTETGPAALFTSREGASAGRIGLPIPGVELKVAPVGERREARVKGPNVTPGFWNDDLRTRDAFDEEGFYRMGDAVRLAAAADPLRGFLFEGRIAEDFKLSTGTWVCVESVRTRLLSHFGDTVHDAVIAGPDRDYVSALVFPARPASRDELQDLLNEFAHKSTGLSTRVARILVAHDPPSADAREITAKGNLNQKAVLENRAALVEQIYADPISLHVIEITEGINK